MTDATVVIIVTSVGAVVAAVPAIIAAINSGAALRQGVDNGEKAAVVADKADTIIQQATEIHTLADGNLSKVTAALGIANEKIAGLEKLMASMIDRRGTGPRTAPEPAAEPRDEDPDDEIGGV